MHLGWMLCGLLVVKQRTILDSFACDPFSFQHDGLTASEVDVGRGKIVDNLVIAPVVVVQDERIELGFEVTGQILRLRLGECGTRYAPNSGLAGHRSINIQCATAS